MMEYLCRPGPAAMATQTLAPSGRHLPRAALRRVRSTPRLCTATTGRRPAASTTATLLLTTSTGCSRRSRATDHAPSFITAPNLTITTRTMPD